ncbi:hypothetical protein BD309DRAFT_336266 [Dichomitus squalens]|nr:hypothetical protein BD309DRAFT_336266 [Dichomitus squalens]
MRSAQLTTATTDTEIIAPRAAPIQSHPSLTLNGSIPAYIRDGYQTRDAQGERPIPVFQVIAIFAHLDERGPPAPRPAFFWSDAVPTPLLEGRARLVGVSLRCCSPHNPQLGFLTQSDV